MEAANSSLQRLKVSGFHLQRFRPHSSLNSRCEGNLCRNLVPTMHLSDKVLQRINKSSDNVSIFSHASAKKSGIIENHGKKESIVKSFCTLNACASIEASSFSENILNISANAAAQERVGVLLLNLGGPETLDDVQPFLFNLFADPDIIRLPKLFRFLQKPLAILISIFRAPKSRKAYASIGGGSPLRRTTDEQAQALKAALKGKGLHANVCVAMRYWHPFTEEAIQQIKQDVITKLVILPLYPQFSISTSGSSIRILQSIFRKDDYFLKTPISIIESWYKRQGYIRSMADLVKKELFKFLKPEEVLIFFSAHGVPLSYIENAGDPYKDQMEECVRLIMGELKSRGVMNSHTLAYQSRVGPIQWLKPYTDEVIVELGRKGVKSLLTVPISFVSEHIETLEEIDMEYKQLALQSGITNWGRVPTLGCTSSFISDLADAVIEAIPSATLLSTDKNGANHADKSPLFHSFRLFLGLLLALCFLFLLPRVVYLFRNNL